MNQFLREYKGESQRMDSDLSGIDVSARIILCSECFSATSGKKTTRSHSLGGTWEALPPWQLVSGKLDGLPLRAATCWATPMNYSTTAATVIEHWPTSITKPGPVAIALSGTWEGKSIGLKGGDIPDGNHAKIGVSTDMGKPMIVVADLNQQGALRTGYEHAGQLMTSSQNGRGGTFYVLENQKLFESMTDLPTGDTAPVNLPNGEQETRPKRRPILAAQP